MKKILVVEDDNNLNKGLCLAFQDKYQVVSAFSIKEGEKFLGNCDAIILDLNLPDGDGLDFIAKIRKSYNLPILVVSARDMEMDIITAIQMGADDYITKPFSLAILKTKMDRHLERLEINNRVYNYGFLKLNFEGRKYTIKDIEIHLTVTEEKILYYLIKANGNIVTRQILLEKIWDTEENFIDENTLSVNVNRLRKKLEPTKYIETIYGVGYRWSF